MRVELGEQGGPPQVLGRLEQGRIRKFLPLSVSLHETLGRARDQIVPSSARLPRLECHDIRRDPHKSILPGLSRSPHPFDRHILAYRHMIVVAMRSAEECSQRLSVFGRHHARDSPECAEARPWRPQCAGEMKERHATLARSAAVMSSARCSSTSSEDRLSISTVAVMPADKDDPRRHLIDMDADRYALGQAHPGEDRVDGSDPLTVGLRVRNVDARAMLSTWPRTI